MECLDFLRPRACHDPVYIAASGGMPAVKLPLEDPAAAAESASAE